MLEGAAAVEPATARANQKSLKAEINQMRMEQRSSGRHAKDAALNDLLSYSIVTWLWWEVFLKHPWP